MATMSHCIVKLSTTGQKIAVPPGQLLMADSRGIYNTVATDIDIINSKYGAEKTLRFLTGKEKEEYTSVTVLGLGNSTKELEPLLVGSTAELGKRVRAPKRKNFTPSIVSLKRLPKKIIRESEKQITTTDKKALNAAKRKVVLDTDKAILKQAQLRKVPQNMDLRESEGSYGRSPSFQEEAKTANDINRTDMDCDYEELSLNKEEVQLTSHSSLLKDLASRPALKEIFEADCDNGDDNLEQSPLLPEHTPSIRTITKPRSLAVSIDTPAPVSREHSLSTVEPDLSPRFTNSESDWVKINEEVSFYKKLANTRFVEILELRTDLSKAQEESNKLRQQVATLVVQQDKGLNKEGGFEKHLAVLEKNLKEYIEKTSENGHELKVGLSRSQKGMVNISPTIQMTAKAYISARNAPDIWKRINWVVAGYWTVEERMKLYFKVVEDEDSAEKREITDKEIADIICICSVLEKENPLEEHEDNDDAERKEEKAEEFKSELIRTVSRKLIVDRSRRKVQNRKKNSVSRQNGKRTREASNVEEEDPKDWNTPELKTGNRVAQENERERDEEESDKENVTQENRYSVIASYSLPVITPP